MNGLKNKTVLVTKSESESRHNLDLLAAEGAEIVFYPTIKIVPVLNSSLLDDALKIFDRFDYIVFTSANAVAVFAEISRINSLSLQGIKIAAVGKATMEACESEGMSIDMLPKQFSAAGLIEEFSKVELKGKKIFIPSSSLSRDELKLELQKMGAEVYSVPVYRVSENDREELKNETERIIRSRPDLYIFTSPSSFNNFLKIMKIDSADTFFENSVICAIGTTTEAAIRKTGLAVHIVPDIFSLTGISESVIRYFKVTENIS